MFSFDWTVVTWAVVAALLFVVIAASLPPLVVSWRYSGLTAAEKATVEDSYRKTIA